jgi:hypothetical protein
MHRLTKGVAAVASQRDSSFSALQFVDLANPLVEPRTGKG